jgi:hypothetical protein
MIGCQGCLGEIRPAEKNAACERVQRSRFALASEEPIDERKKRRGRWPTAAESPIGPTGVSGLSLSPSVSACQVLGCLSCLSREKVRFCSSGKVGLLLPKTALSTDWVGGSTV